MSAQVPARTAWKAAHRKGRVLANIPAWLRPHVDRGIGVAHARDALGIRDRPAARPAAVAILLACAADARRCNRHEGARTWLAFAHVRNQLGA